MNKQRNAQYAESDRDLSAKEQRRLIQDCAHWTARAERAEAKVAKLEAALAKSLMDALGGEELSYPCPHRPEDVAWVNDGDLRCMECGEQFDGEDA